VGRVGTGWDRKTARAIRHALEPLARPTAPKATIATPFPKVVFRPIAGDDELLHFNAAWLPHNDNPALRRFLSLVRSTANKSGAALVPCQDQLRLGLQLRASSAFCLPLSARSQERLGLLT